MSTSLVRRRLAALAPRCVRMRCTLSVSSSRCFSTPAAAPTPDASPPLPPPPANSRRGFLVHANRGFVANDPLPGRPPEDDIATAPLYYEALANLHHYEKETGPQAILDRLTRLRDPRTWCVVWGAMMLCRRRSRRRLSFPFDGHLLSPGDHHYAPLS